MTPATDGTAVTGSTPAAAGGPVSVSIVGSTGSIGTQTLDVVSEDPGRYEVVAIGAQRSVDLLVAQALEFRPDVVAIGDASLARRTGRPPSRRHRGGGRRRRAGRHRHGWPTWSSTAWSGFAGLHVTLAALEAGSRLALANKESIIAGAPVVARVRRTPGAEILPVDSEHCAVHQCLRAGTGRRRGPAAADRLGRTVPGSQGRRARRRRGRRGAGPSDLVHGAEDHGGLLHADEQGSRGHRGPRAVRRAATTPSTWWCTPSRSSTPWWSSSTGPSSPSCRMPDMRLPIGYALAYPGRLATAFGAIDWAELSVLEFEPPDRSTFPCLDLAYRAGRTGDLAPAWLNAANEVAVGGLPRRSASPGPPSPRWSRRPSTATRRPDRRRTAPWTTYSTPTPRPDGWPASSSHSAEHAVSAVDVRAARRYPPNPSAGPPGGKSAGRSLVELGLVVSAVIVVSIVTGRGRPADRGRLPGRHDHAPRAGSLHGGQARAT